MAMVCFSNFMFFSDWAKNIKFTHDMIFFCME